MSSQKMADFSLTNALVSKCHMRKLWNVTKTVVTVVRGDSGVGWGGGGFEETHDGSSTSAIQ